MGVSSLETTMSDSHTSPAEVFAQQAQRLKDLFGAEPDPELCDRVTATDLPFTLVPAAVPVSEVVGHLHLGTRPGFLSPDTADIDRFIPIDGIDLPGSPVYAVLDVDRGLDTRNWTPEEAMEKFTADGRSPLTIAEGVAFLLHHPAMLEKNKCFQTPGSRCGDRRVPGLWISNRAPKLGWCWAGNRHTWLGIGSCAGRT